MDVGMARWFCAESHEGPGAEPRAWDGTDMDTVEELTDVAVHQYPGMHVHCAVVRKRRARRIPSWLRCHVSPAAVHEYTVRTFSPVGRTASLSLGSPSNQVATDPGLCDSITAFSTGPIASCAPVYRIRPRI